MAHRAQQLLEHSLLSELRAVVARALSGLDMFAGGQLSELDLLGSDLLENAERDVRTPPGCWGAHDRTRVNLAGGSGPSVRLDLGSTCCWPCRTMR